MLPSQSETSVGEGELAWSMQGVGVWAWDGHGQGTVKHPLSCPPTLSDPISSVTALHCYFLSHSFTRKVSCAQHHWIIEFY